MKNLFYFAVIIGLMMVTPLSSKNKAEAEASVITVNSTELSGVVFDQNTNETLAGVLITVNGQKVYTDFEGQFKVKNVCIGVCELKVTLISYQERTLRIDTAKENSLKVALSQR